MSKGKLIELSMINTTSTPTEIVWKLEDEEKTKDLRHMQSFIHLT